MSAIYGMINTNNLGERDGAALELMRAAACRGGEVFEHATDVVVLGQSASGCEASHKPAQTQDKKLTAVFRGRLSNAEELASDLERKGLKCEHSSHASIIANSFDAYGESAIKKLRGAYAFALWDAESRTLTLARDRAGEKRMFYMKCGGSIVFSSEITPLLAHPDFTRRCDPSALHHLLTLSHVPSPATMFEGILKLPPAHTMTITVSEAVKRQYWYPHKIRTEKKSLSRTEPSDLLGTLKESVAASLSGVENAGALLTGGIDSAAAAALATDTVGLNIKTFSIKIEGHGSPDDYTSLVASHFGFEHTEISAGDDEIAAAIPRHIFDLEEPPADPSSLPKYMLYAHAAGKVSSALCGEGGDTLFAGEARYVADKYLHYYNVLPAALRKNLLAPLFAMASHSVGPGLFNQRLVQMATVSPMSDAQRHASWMQFFSQPEKASIYTPEMTRWMRGVEPADIIQRTYDAIDEHHGVLPASGAKSFTDKQILADFFSLLPESMLLNADRASAASGLEILCPFLGKDMIELSLSLPADLKIKGASTKRILKQALWNVLPAEALYRNEQCLGLPLDALFRGRLRDAAHDALTDSTALDRGIFAPQAVQKLLEDHEKGYRDNGEKLWILLNVELWHRTFIDRCDASGPISLG